MRFELRNVTNGAVLRIEYDIGDEVEELVYQEQDEEGNDVEAFADFLRTIHEQYGPSTGRRSPKRIYISVAPGDKYDEVSSCAGDGDGRPPIA
jgi:hypothetical protein